MRRLALFFLIAASLSVGYTHAQSQRQAQKMIAMTPDDFYGKVKVTGDELDDVITIETSEGLVIKQGMFGAVWDDNYLAAFVNKKSGETTFRVYQQITYTGDWRIYSSVSYESPEGPISKPLDLFDRDVISCSKYNCLHQENMSFEVDESLLRVIAGAFQQNAAKAWKMRFRGRSPEGYTTAILPAEVIALLRAVDEQRSIIARKGTR